jgi:hypothetical protein
MRRTSVWTVSLALALAAGAAPASTVVGLSIEDQARLSRIVAIGEVVGLAGVDDPGAGIETAVSFRVSDVLKGTVEPGESVVFHTREGEVGGVRSEAPGEARFRIGQKALVFIEDVDGRLYNLGLSMGVWNVQERDGAVTGFTRALTDGLEVIGEQGVEVGPVAHRDMVSRVAWASSHPEFEHPMLRSALRSGR